MARPTPSTTLYRLIEAGQRAHRALLASLRVWQLEPGDEVVLFALPEDPITEAVLAAAVGVTAADLGAALARLRSQGIVASDGAPDAIVLTAAGRSIRQALAEHWIAVEDQLFSGVEKKGRKTLRKALDQMSSALSG